MRIVYFDCVGGVSGDMLLSALLDAGASEEGLRTVIKKLGLADCDIRVERVMKGALAACQVTVITPRKETERHLSELLAIINQADFSEEIKSRACSVIQKIAAVEAGIHNIPIDSIHLHEVGGDDTLIDVLGVLNALQELNIQQVYTSPLPLA
ncbi:MAG: LarC family nickel insertion protein, partial [Anaerolineae bacterium]|nr:LarC family nickel insertion protein [Anaerolineae bacterium]